MQTPSIKDLLQKTTQLTLQVLHASINDMDETWYESFDLLLLMWSYLSKIFFLYFYSCSSKISKLLFFLLLISLT